MSTYVGKPALAEVELSIEFDATMFATFPALDRMLSKLEVFSYHFMQAKDNQAVFETSKDSQGSCRKTPRKAIFHEDFRIGEGGIQCT